MIDLKFYKGKKVFITGHTGFKGSWLCEILIDLGAEVMGYSLAPNTSPSLFQILSLENRMSSHIGDVRNLALLREALVQFEPEFVFHLAAQPLVRESYQNPVETYEINVMGTVNILESIRACKSVKSVINVTTDKVYENKEWHWGYRENENLCGFDPYSNSKSCSELVTYSYINSFFKESNAPAISTARSGNVIGGGDFSKDRIVPDCIAAGGLKSDIIVRNPYSTRPYQHVLECLSGYLLLAKCQYENKVLSGNYNFGPKDSDCVETGNLVELFCNKWGMNLNWINRADNGPHEANFLKLDCSKAKNVLKWNQNWSIDQAIEKTVEWAKAYNSKENMIEVTKKQVIDYFICDNK